MKEFGESESIFKDMDALNPSQDAYMPTKLPEREEELDDIHSALRPVEMGKTPINLLIYGETGQGKTVAVNLKTDQLQKWADQQDIELTVVTIECKGLDKSYNVMTNLIKELREVRLGPGEDPPKGYQRKELFHLILDEIEQIGGTVIIVLDEIDALGADDYILYELPRASFDNAKISLIGVTNDLTYTQHLDSDVRSSLGEDEILFAPYDSLQLNEILSRRASNALHETGFSCPECNSPECPHDVAEQSGNFVSNIIQDGTIDLAASYAARNTGDAREALRILYSASRIADKNDRTNVTTDDVEAAREKIEQEVIARGVSTLASQKMIALMTVIYGHVKRPNDDPASLNTTSKLYTRYKKYCNSEDHAHVSNRRFLDILNELTDQSLLTKQRQTGRGQENQYTLNTNLDMTLENLPQENERFASIATHLRDLN